MQTLDESEIILWFIRRYEEYPTSPASFVLNGFIYSLLGLYDLNATVPASLSRDAGHLYEQGMISLKKMLLLFDTGSGTIYDLRHFTLGMSGSKVFNESKCTISGWQFFVSRYRAEHCKMGLPCNACESTTVTCQNTSRSSHIAYGRTMA